VRARARCGWKLLPFRRVWQDSFGLADQGRARHAVLRAALEAERWGQRHDPRARLDARAVRRNWAIPHALEATRRREAAEGLSGVFVVVLKLPARPSLGRRHAEAADELATLMRIRCSHTGFSGTRAGYEMLEAARAALPMRYATCSATIVWKSLIDAGVGDDGASPRHGEVGANETERAGRVDF